MGDFLHEHFSDLLVTALIVFFTLVTLHMLHLKTANDDSFKWSAGIVGMFVGALLMRMKSNTNGTPANNTSADSTVAK
jgi:membrane associated rhomboid family serine protease